MQKILIVEDDIDIQDILKNHLIDAGYEVAVASDGVAGIAMFDDTIDLLLLDIMLPKIDGYKKAGQNGFDSRTPAVLPDGTGRPNCLSGKRRNQRDLYPGRISTAVGTGA